MIDLTIQLPHRTLFAGPVRRVVAEGPDGSRGFLPQHIDFVMPLESGVLTCTDAEGMDVYFALRGGVLTKKSRAIFVATPHAVMAESLAQLPGDILKIFADEDEHERVTQTASAHLETAMLRQLRDLSR